MLFKYDLSANYCFVKFELYHRMGIYIVKFQSNMYIGIYWFKNSLEMVYYLLSFTKFRAEFINIKRLDTEYRSTISYGLHFRKSCLFGIET